ncbi:asparagine synthase-related protein [Sphingomonas aerolata]|uniref:asparagine synthase-related protein n=1 Tax=Sphingomonas aerolata TaxID=185951 RepID=UPI003A5BD6AD
MRLRHGEGKWLMKKAMEPYLPKEILYRPKMGFVTPISAWFRGTLAGEGERARIVADARRDGLVRHGRDHRARRGASRRARRTWPHAVAVDDARTVAEAGVRLGLAPAF